MIEGRRGRNVGARVRNRVLEWAHLGRLVRWRREARIASRAAILLSACAYYSARLDVREVSLLESQDLGIACDLFKTYALSPDHSPLHFVFLNLWQRLNSSSVAFLRFPSVVCCSLAVLVVFSIADALAGSVAGLVAAAFMILNPDVVDVARSMRLYSLVVLSSSMCLWFAYGSLTGSKRTRALLGFAAWVVVALYTHLFTWLLVAPLGLLLTLDVRRNWSSPESRRAVKYAVVTIVLLLPQVVHSFVTVAFVRERHGLYSGLPSSPIGFLIPIVRTLFLGELEASVPLDSYFILAPGVLVAVGLACLKRRDAGLIVSVFVPALCGAWWLSRSSPVEPRYLCFLTPLLAVLMGVGAARASSAHVLAPLTLTSIWIFTFASQGPYALRTDWYEAAATIQKLARPTDVVAVFPGYWTATFQRYTKIRDVVPITFPIDLERLLARGRRVLLVRNSGRYFGNLEALLTHETLQERVFASVIRDPIAVYTVSDTRPPPPAARLHMGSILLTGTFGSGGYPWQTNPDANPLRRLKSLFAGSGVVFTAYEAYNPPWYAPLLLGADETRRFEPNTEAIYQLTRAGISEAVLACTGPECQRAADLLTANGVSVVARASRGDTVKPAVFPIAGVMVGVFGIAKDLLDEDPAAVLPQLQASIGRARESVGESGKLVALIPAEPDYGRLATSRERRVARRLVDLGVDVVVGEGGYAAKEIEEYHQGIIAYSLGTLLRPPTLSLAMQESSGLALRLSFLAGKKLRYKAIPLTFDDTCQATLGDAVASRRLASPNLPGASDSLLDRLADAKATYRSADGAMHSMGTFHAEGTCLSAIEQWFYSSTASASYWFPETPLGTPLRPFEGAFCGAAAHVAQRGVLSLGEYRRAVELEAGAESAVGLRFERVPLGTTLQLGYGIPDDRLLSKFLPLQDETVVVEVDDRRVFSSPLPYQTGWRDVSIDTSAFARTAQDIRISIETNGSHFPIAFDPEISEDTQ